MHPHTRAEDDSLSSPNYGIMAEIEVSDQAQPWRQGAGPPRVNPVTLLGYDPFLSATITADLDQPVTEAEFRFHLGQAPHNLSPHMFFGGVMWQGRALFDPGRYITLRTKCFSTDPILVPAVMPTFQSAGPFQASTSTVTPSWGPHQAGDVGFLVVQSANQAVTLSDAQGFVEMPGSPIGTGAAGGSGTVDYNTNTAQFSGTANPTTQSFTPAITPRGIYVYIFHEGGADIITGVTYGGVALTRVMRQADTGGVETGSVYLYFRGDSIPTGAQTLSIARTEATTAIWGTVGAPTGAGDLEIVDVQGDDGVPTNPTDPAVSLSFGGRTCVAYVGCWSSVNALTGVTDRAGQTRLQANDFGNSVAMVSRRTSLGTTDQTLGYTIAQNAGAIIGFTVAQLAGSGTRETWFWKRATSSNMAAPTVAALSDHVAAQILVFRGCIPTGDPWDSTPQTNVQATASATVAIPALTTTAEQCLLVMSVSTGVKTSSPQMAWAQVASLPEGIRTERTDRYSAVGSGGGFSVATAPKVVPGLNGLALGGTLSTPAPQVRFIFALRPRPAMEISVSKSDIPFRPVFVGRIDSADPASDNGDVLVVRCRDILCNMLDAWIEPGPSGGWVTGDQPIDEHMQELLSIHQLSLNPDTEELWVPFIIVGDPSALFVPQYRVDPQPLLLALRTAGLQNGWDLRGRWFEDSSGDYFACTYYEPDRYREGGSTIISPTRYYALTGLAKDRTEVRNVVEVTPADPPREPYKLPQRESIARYGRRYLGVSEDATSFILTHDQAVTLAVAIMNDTQEPKVEGVIEMRYFPFIEVNDLVTLPSNFVHHDLPLTLAVSGYTHTLAPDENGGGQQAGVTTLRTRFAPAAASREWRQTEQKTQYTGTSLPSGKAVEGALYTTVEEGE